MGLLLLQIYAIRCYNAGSLHVFDLPIVRLLTA